MLPFLCLGWHRCHVRDSAVLVEPPDGRIHLHPGEDGLGPPARRRLHHCDQLDRHLCLWCRRHQHHAWPRVFLRQHCLWPGRHLPPPDLLVRRLDEPRVLAKRDGVLPCVIHPENSTGFSCILSLKSSWNMGTLYAHLLSSKLFKVVALVITFGLFSVGAYGWSLMRMKFDPVLLLPGDTYLRKWVDIHSEYYPENGWTADVYSESLNHTHLASIEELTNGFEDLRDAGGLRAVNSWWPKMKEFAAESKNMSLEDLSNKETFPIVLSDFLFSASGAPYKNNFIFNEPLICNSPAPKINASKFSIEYFFMDDPDQHIPARGAVTDLLNLGSGPYSFSHSKVYAAWETDEIIGFELWRNIGLAMACVFVVTLLLLANFQICVYVMCIVGITLTDIVGFLHFWDVTIDIISCVNIVLAIGLCVDYSVHIGLAFMVAKGSRQDKAVEAA